MNRIKKFLQLRGGGEKQQRLENLLSQAVKTQKNGIKKSSSDTRVYRAVKLPNGLEAIVISDPKTEKAAAALTVNVGSYSDPFELPGLAHFLEHMLFMGTKKYPDENEYSEFLSENGGYSNAYTASELTNYQFEVISSQLKGALDRFAQFFIEPLLLEDATDREIKAVDNECSGNQQNDSWRSYLIYRELANEKHPIHKFNIGNLETLKHEPEKQGINTREALLKFYKQYYSANRMRLVVIGKESLDELEGLVVEMFSAVPNKNLPCPYVHPDPSGPAFDEGNLKKFIHVVPVRDIRRIEVLWVLPKMTTANKLREASSFLSSLIGDEGEGSILSYLKQKSWANALSAGKSDDNYDLASFEVTIHCTDLGITKHVNDIIEVVYNYINMLHKTFEDFNNCAYFFEETKMMSAIRYWFKPEAAPLGYVTGLAASFQKDIPTNDILTTGYLNLQDSFAEVKHLLSEMKPENMICYISSKANEGIADREETYFKTKFGVSDIPEDFATQLREASDFEKIGLKITPPNQFIPTNFDVAAFEEPKLAKLHETASPFLKAVASLPTVVCPRTLQHANIVDKVAVVKDTVERSLMETWEDDTFRRPIVIHSEETATVWLKQDTTHKKPKSRVKIFLKNPVVNESLFATFATSLFISLMQDTLNEVTYAAESAGFGNSIGSNNNGIVMTFTGFAETIHKYVELVAKKLKGFADEKVEESLFIRFKEQLLKNIINVEKARPISLARMSISQSLNEKTESIEDKFTVAKAITLEQILKFAPRIFENVGIEILVSGNARTKDAMEILKISKAVFNPTASVANHMFKRTVDLLSTGKPQQKFFLQAARDPQNPGSALCVLFQFGTRTDEKMALLSLFSDILHEQFFNDLRTKQTLGYIVQAGFGFDNGVLSLMFYVESNSADPIALNFKVEKFIDDLQEGFDKTFEAERFKDLVNAELNSLLSRSNTISAETSKWWGSIGSGLYTFENARRVADCLTRATPQDLKGLLAEYMWNGAPKRAKFVSGMLGDPHGTKIFGEKYDDMKPKTENNVRLGFDESFVVEWMKQDVKLFETFVKSRGEIEVIANIADFKAKATFHPTYQEILSKL